jgi:hypothetical protein
MKQKGKFLRMVELLLDPDNAMEQVTAMSVVKAPAIKIPFVAMGMQFKEKPFREVTTDPSLYTEIHEKALRKLARLRQDSERRQNSRRPRTKLPLSNEKSETPGDINGFEEPRMRTMSDRLKGYKPVGFVGLTDRIKMNNAAVKQSQIV